MILIAMVATALVFSTLLVIERGLKTSRRSGDSANALQVADAGLNDAIKAIPTIAQTQSSFSRTGTVGSASFSYSASQDASNAGVWHIDAVGLDQTGVKRHLRADAVGQPLFASPMYINTGLSAQAGTTLDSFHSGSSLVGPSANYTDGGCTDKGIMFFSPTATVSFNNTSGGGSGTSVLNCNQNRFGGSWKYVMDGCIVYGGGAVTSGMIGNGKCPDPNDATFPGRTKSITQTFQPPSVQAPTGPGVVSGTTLNCSNDPRTATTPSLRAGTTYSFTDVTLGDGCFIDFSLWPNASTTLTPTIWEAASSPRVKIYSRTLTLSSGTHGVINPPPTSSYPNLCGSSVNSWAYQDVNKNPASYYCNGWVKSLSLNLLTKSNATVAINGNGGFFWGTFTAPDATVTLQSPNMEFWGAMLAGNLTVKNQFSWHYDDSLSSIGTGKFNLSNWREEPL